MGDDIGTSSCTGSEVWTAVCTVLMGDDNYRFDSANFHTMRISHNAYDWLVSKC